MLSSGAGGVAGVRCCRPVPVASRASHVVVALAGQSDFANMVAAAAAAIPA
jgi:hypothetical protein